MSFILEALKRSEAERQRQPAEVLAKPALTGAPPARGRNWTPWLALILLINAMLLLALFWPERSAPPETVTPATPRSTPASPGPATTATADEDAATATELPTPRPGGLAEAAGYGRQGTDEKPVTPPPRTPADTAPATPSAQPAAKPAATTAAEPPLLSELPEAVRSAIPPIPVNIHVYAPEPASRFVLIDMRRYTEGQTLHSGPRLETITADGLVLEHQGRRFRIRVR